MKEPRQKTGSDLFSVASDLWDRGRMKAAYRLFLEGAKHGDADCLLWVGYMNDLGSGVRRNRAEAMRHYLRAYRKRSAAGAKNIATIYRDEENLKRAKEWFLRASKLGDDDSLLELGKLLMAKDLRRAARLIRRAIESRSLDEASLVQAKRLLASLKKRPGRDA